MSTNQKYDSPDQSHQPPSLVTALTVTTSSVPVRVGGVAGADVEAYEELKILHCLTQRVELIRQPEVSKLNIEERSEEDSLGDVEQPEASVVSECSGGVEHEESHDDDEGERVGVAWYGELVRVEEGED